MNSLEPANEYCRLAVGHCQYPFRLLRTQGKQAVFDEIRAQVALWLPRYRGDGKSATPRFGELDLVHSCQGIVAVVVSQVMPVDWLTVREAVRYGFECGREWVAAHPWRPTNDQAVRPVREASGDDVLLRMRQGSLPEVP